MAEIEEKLKSLLMRGKEESGKGDLNPTFLKLRSWHLVPVETVTDFIFLGSKITADGDCSHEIKRCLLLGRKAMTNLDRVLKKQRYHFADKCPYSQSYGFSSSHV